MKALLLILDGVPEGPIEALGGLTPLEAARTPNLNRLARRGLNGLMDVVAPGVAASTELAHHILFGHRLEEFPGRGFVETLGDGFAFGEGDVLFSTSFASVEAGAEGFSILRRDWALAEAEWGELARCLEPFEAEGLRAEFLYSSGGYGRLKLSGGASDEVTDSDPFYPGLPVAEVRPRRGHEDDPRTLATCRALNAYLLWAHGVLEASPFNRSRRRRGLKPINFLLVKWAGRPRALVPFEERWGMRGLSIGSSPVLRGTALLSGLDYEDFPAADEAGEDLGGRLGRALELFGGYDFVHVHTKAADDAAHGRRPEEKVRVIEALDGALEALEAGALGGEEVLWAVTSDHATPSAGGMVHSGDPVPLVLAGGRVLADAVEAYSERAAQAGGLGRIRGGDLMPLVLNYTDRANLYPWRPLPHQSLARPRRVPPLRRPPR